MRAYILVIGYEQVSLLLLSQGHDMGIRPRHTLMQQTRNARFIFRINDCDPPCVKPLLGLLYAGAVSTRLDDFLVNGGGNEKGGTVKPQQLELVGVAPIWWSIDLV